MNNYISADLKRISVRVPRIIALLILFAVEIIFTLILTKTGEQSITAVGFMAYFGQFTGFVVPVALELIELHAIYADDFKAKTMQIAIGVGVKRRHIVLSKLFEMIILVTTDLILYGLVIVVAATITGLQLQSPHFLMLASYLISNGISIVAYTALAMILIFYMQSTGVGVLLYLLLSLTIANKIFGVILSLGFLETLSLGRFLVTDIISKFYTSLMLGSFHVRSFIGILIYIVISYIATIMLFKKRELEF